MSELARSILGALILKPILLENVDLTAADFSEGRERETFQGITEIWETTRLPEIPLPVLAKKISGNGAYTFISSLIDGNIRIDPATFSYLVGNLRHRRLSEHILKLSLDESERMVKTGEVDPGRLEELRRGFAEIQGLDAKGFDPAKVLLTGTQIKALDIKVEWTVDKLVPERAITLLHSPGGLGKSWLCLALAKAISEGLPFLGLPTKRRPVVYVDLENPLSVHKERVCEINLGDNYRLWHLSFDPRPPKLDGPDWRFYKALPPGSVMFFDTCRACHDGKENDSDVAALVMGRLKEVRERDQTIILLHHTPRANDKVSKGSTAWTDLADQSLAFYRNHRGTFEKIEADGFDPNALLFFGTGDKSRYERAQLSVTFNPATGEFIQAEDPNTDLLNALAEYIAGEGLGKNQTEIINWAKDIHGGGRRENFSALLRRGEREGRWHTRRGFKGAKRYEPAT